MNTSGSVCGDMRRRAGEIIAMVFFREPATCFVLMVVSVVTAVSVFGGLYCFYLRCLHPNVALLERLNAKKTAMVNILAHTNGETVGSETPSNVEDLTENESFGAGAWSWSCPLLGKEHGQVLSVCDAVRDTIEEHSYFSTSYPERK